MDTGLTVIFNNFFRHRFLLGDLLYRYLPVRLLLCFDLDKVSYIVSLNPTFISGKILMSILITHHWIPSGDFWILDIPLYIVGVIAVT